MSIERGTSEARSEPAMSARAKSRIRLRVSIERGTSEARRADLSNNPNQHDKSSGTRDDFGTGAAHEVANSLSSVCTRIAGGCASSLNSSVAHTLYDRPNYRLADLEQVHHRAHRRWPDAIDTR